MHCFILKPCFLSPPSLFILRHFISWPRPLPGCPIWMWLSQNVCSPSSETQQVYSDVCPAPSSVTDVLDSGLDLCSLDFLDQLDLCLLCVSGLTTQPPSGFCSQVSLLVMVPSFMVLRGCLDLSFCPSSQKNHSTLNWNIKDPFGSILGQKRHKNSNFS